MFVDASAIVAILTGEPEAKELSAKLLKARGAICSALAQFEAVLGIARLQQISAADAEIIVRELLSAADAAIVPITAEVGALAVAAHQHFGKGRHKAKLNMGDCFAYACAKSQNVPILCKGNDFRHTDIKIA